MAVNILELQREINQAKAPGSMVFAKNVNGNTGSSASSSKAEDPKTLMQRVREEDAQPKNVSMPSQSQIRADAARKRLDRYMKSDERKAWAKKQQDDLYAQSLLTGITDGQWTPEQDETEKRLTDEVKYWENQGELEQNAVVAQKDMEEIAQWDETDREELEKYIKNRESAFVASFSPFATGLPAEYENSPLIQKYGRERLDEIARTYQRQQNEQEYKQAEQTGRNQANEGFFSATAANAASVGANLADTLLNPLERITQMASGKDDRYSTLDPYAGGQAAAYASGVRQQTQENIEGGDPGLVRKGLSVAYQGTMAAADSLARGAVGGAPVVGAGLAALGSFNRTVTDASARGASPEQAVALATINAGIEAATEKLPLDELFKAAKGGAKPAGAVIRNILKQAGIEATEEEISLIGTTLAEAAILQEKSGYNQQVMEAVLGGATYEEARAQANHALLAEAINTALVSGVSGGFSAGGAEYYAAKYGNSQTAQQPANQTTEQRQELTDGREQSAPEAAVQPDPEQDQIGALLEGIRQEQVSQEVEKRDLIDQAYEMTMAAEQKGSEELPPHERGTRYRASKINTAILNLVDRVKKGVAQGKEKVQLGTVSDANAAQIQRETGIDTRGYYVAIEARQIEHILNRHGENGAANRSMANPEDIARIEYALNNPDRISKSEPTKAYVTNRDGKMKPADTVLYETRLEDGSYYVVQAVPETKKRTLYVVSAFIGEPGYKNEAPQSTNVIDPGATPEAESTATSEEAPKSTDINNPDVTPEADSAGASTNSVPQKINEVNGNIDESSAQEADILQESSERGQIKGTGAAERGFTPKQAAINEYGNIPEGENPVRPDQLPTSTDGTDRVSYTARTALEARVTPDEFVPLIENETMRGGFSFIPIHNDDTTRAATESISRDGWQTARANWTANVRAGVTSPEITATGALLYNHALNAGNRQEAMDILLDYQMSVRNTARSLQAARILKTLTPSDRLYMIRRSVDAMVQDMGLDTPVTIDENLAQQYQQAGTQEEADVILDQIAENVARQIPATRMEAFTALRYLNMLGNFRTQGRNVAGNIGSKVVYGFKDKVAAGIETIAHHLSGGRMERTKSLVADSATQRAAAADYETVRDWVLGGGRYNDRQTESDDFARRVQDRRRILPPGLEHYRRATQWAMDTGDEIFTRSAYSRALAGYLNARGIRTDNLESVDPDILDRAREYAVRQAQEQTFRDNNRVSDFVGGILRGRNTPAWARVIGEGVMPFRKTPANVLVRAEEFSPLGVINSTVNTIRAAIGEITGADLIDSWAKTLTGTALFALGMSLFDMGVLSGGPDEDEEKAGFDHLNGMQDYAITVTVDGKPYSYTIDWATPAAMPLFLGAQMQKVFSGKEDLTWADMEKVLTSVGDPLIQMSMLQGVNDTLENIRYADNNLGQFLINATMSYLTQGLTNTLLGQVEKSTEETRQTTYVDKDNNVPQWLQKQLGKASQKIPGWDYQQTDYINARGETEEQRTDAMGWVYNLASPGYLDKAEIDDVSKELYRLHDAGVEGNVFPETPSTTLTWTDKTGEVHKDNHLTAEQAETLKRETGQTYMRIVRDITQSKDYAALTDAQKGEVLHSAESYARKTGEIAAIGDDHTGYDEVWMMELEEGKEADQVLRRVVKSQLANAAAALDTAWSKGYDEKPRSDEMKWAYDTFNDLSLAAKNQIKRESESSVVNYLEARENGISHEKYVDVAKLLDGIVPETGYSNPRPIQKAETIAKSRTLSENQKKLLIKQQVSDSQDKNIDELYDLGYGVDVYVKLYRDYEGYTHGNGKKKRTAQKWSEEYDISMDAAYKLYEVFP